jgi:hypothetical protein
MSNLDVSARAYSFRHYRTMAASWLALETEQARRRSDGDLHRRRQSALSVLSRQVSTENPLEARNVSAAGGISPWFRIPKLTQVHISDALIGKALCQEALREASLARDWHVANVDEGVDAGVSERRNEILDRASLVADGMEYRHAACLVSPLYRRALLFPSLMPFWNSGFNSPAAPA